MATTKKETKKADTKADSAKAKAAKPPEEPSWAPPASLDPLLMLSARRAGGEKVADLRALRTAPAASSARVGELPLGMMSMASRMSPRGLAQLLDEDRIPVLLRVAGKDAGELIQGRVGKWKGSAAEALSDKTLRAKVPRSRLRQLAQMKQVEFVEASSRLKPHCELAHKSARLDRSPEGVSETGEGVLVGVVDTGIDCGHDAFLGADGKSRIVDYLDQTTGAHYKRNHILAGHGIHSPDADAHGTHVAGIAAGSGKHPGVAPGAQLAVVKTTFDSADIAAAVAHIFRKAGRKPCVVNLSLGGHYGAHDGSSVVERTIDDLSGPGRVVVASAGNEGADHIHASAQLGGEPDRRWTADLELRPRIIQGQELGLLVMQVWHRREDVLEVKLRSPSGELYGAALDTVEEVDRGIFFVEVLSRKAAYSDDYVTTFQIIATPDWTKGWSVVVHGEQVNVGSVHAWILDEAMGRFTKGYTISHLVGMPGTAFSAVTVASYATRKKWSSVEGPIHLDSMHPEDISYFSSPGPTRDGHNKPELAAPGQWLLAPLSQHASLETMPSWLREKGGKYAALQGTSMSAPYVTGALALLLQKEPKLDWSEVKRRIIKSCRHDQFTSDCWNKRWGYGKLDVERLLRVEPA